MADSSEYKIELVSADSDTGESTVVRGITYKPNIAARRQKHYRRPKDVEKCENFKRFGLSVCILLASAMALWIIVLSLLLTELFKRTVELQTITGQTSVQTDELTAQIQNWHNFSKSIGKDQTLQMKQISALGRELANVTVRLAKMEKKLIVVEEKENRPQQLFHVVQDQVSTLTSSIAGLNSEVENMKSKLAGFRDDEDRREQILLNIKVNMSLLAETLSMLNKTIHDTQTNSGASLNASNIVSKAVESVRPNIISMNESLSKRLRYLSEDQNKDHKLFIELQESLANVSSQVISLLQNSDAWKTNFDRLELKILTIREQLRAIQAKPHENVSCTQKTELMSATLPRTADESIVMTRSPPAVEDRSSTLLPSPSLMISLTPVNHSVT